LLRQSQNKESAIKPSVPRRWFHGIDRLGDHGLAESDVYNSGLFRGAIDRIRGQFAATMNGKREFVLRVLSHMQDGEYIHTDDSPGGKNRRDYAVMTPSGRIAVVELKGCLDGKFCRAPARLSPLLWRRRQ
jgi:hypothetical protein